jgi:ATP-dependent DNA ligase
MQPIIPIRRKEPFNGDGWLFELKLDGFRGLADTVNGRMLSKNGNRMRRFSGDYIANGQRGLIGLKSM